MPPPGPVTHRMTGKRSAMARNSPSASSAGRVVNASGIVLHCLWCALGEDSRRPGPPGSVLLEELAPRFGAAFAEISGPGAPEARLEYRAAAGLPCGLSAEVVSFVRVLGR